MVGKPKGKRNKGVDIREIGLGTLDWNIWLRTEIGGGFS
jgi:hypothetical protein